LARLGCRTMQRTFADRGSGLAFGCLFRGRLCLGFGLGLGFGLRFCRGGFLLGLGSGFGFFLLLSALLLFDQLLALAGDQLSLLARFLFPRLDLSLAQNRNDRLRRFFDDRFGDRLLGLVTLHEHALLEN